MPDDLDEDVVESDLKLEGDVVEQDNDDTPQKVPPVIAKMVLPLFCYALVYFLAIDPAAK